MKVKRVKKTTQKLKLNKIKTDGKSSLNKAVDDVKKILKKKEIKAEVKPEVDFKPSVQDLIRVKGLKKNKNKPGSKNEATTTDERGVIYIGHLPHGFYESELRKFFSQIGRVTNVRVSRAAKSGKSKGYAFVEFEYKEVAEKAAESMQNYLMFNRLVKVQLIDPAKAHDNYFKGRPWSETSYPRLKKRLKRIKSDKKPVTSKKHKEFVDKSVKKMSKLSEKLKTAGINIKFKLGDVTV